MGDRKLNETEVLESTVLNRYICKTIKEQMMKAKKTINEASLSRIFAHIAEHETGTITAYRGFKEDQTSYIAKENQQRNKSLLAKLMRLGYSVIKVSGTYIENFKKPNAKEVKEASFFVTDIKDSGNLKSDLKKLGTEFEQDSIMVIPRGGKNTILIGVNNTGWPGLNEIVSTGDRNLGNKDEFLSKVNGRPFTFSESLEEKVVPQNIAGKQALALISNQKWEDIEV